MLCLRGAYERKSYIFSLLIFFPQHKSRYSGSFICYMEENDQENKTNIRKVQCERVWGMKKGRESKRRQNSSENKALSWEGWKGLDTDAYLRKMISGSFPTAPNASFFPFSLSFSHFTVGSRARNLVEISLSGFIHPKLLKHLAPEEFVLFVYLYFLCYAHPQTQTAISRVCSISFFLWKHFVIIFASLCNVV